MILRFWRFLKALDLDAKPTAASLLLMLVAWLLDYIRSPTTTLQLVIPFLLIVMLAFFLLMLSENLRREKKIMGLIEKERDFLRTEFPQLMSRTIHIREDLSRLGLVSVRKGRDDERFLELLRGSREEVCLMAISLYHYVTILRTVLPSLLADRQLRVKILVAQRDAPFLREKEREEGIENRIKTEIDGIEGMLRQIVREAKSKGYSGRFEVRQYYGIPYCSLYIFDNATILYNPYLRNSPGKDLPVYEFRSC